jgi:PAS domain S-box-containing protein
VEAWPSPFRRAQKNLPYAYAAGFVAAYAATTAVAYTWTVGTGGLAVLWPCNGILAAAFLLLRRRDAIVAALICATIDGVASLWLGSASGGRSLLIAGCDLAEAFSAAMLMRRFCGAAVDMISTRRLLQMLFLAALPATLTVGTLGVLLSHVLFGDSVGLLWLTWAVGDLMGMMIGAPSALIIARFSRYLREDSAGPAESLAIVCGLCGVATAQLFLGDQRDAFLLFPFMLLAAFRISPPYSALAVVLASAITAALTIGGVGPFASAKAGSGVNMLRLQLFLACLTFSTLIAQGWLTSLSRARLRAARTLAAARQAAARAEENAARLSESEARYRILAENTADIIQRVDTDYIIRYASPSIRQLGYEPGDLVGRPAVSIVHPDQREDILRRREALVLGESLPTWEIRILSASGEPVWMESSTSPIRDEAGQLIGVVNVLRNITERKAAEAALREVNAELLRVSRVSALGVFASSLAHELNQPLAAIVTNCDSSLLWLSREPPQLEQASRSIERTRDNAWRMSQIIARLRSLVTKAAPIKTEFDVNDAIREALELTQSLRAEARVSLDLTLGRGPRLILGDRIQFQQVIMNLAANAIEAMQEVPTGERRLAVSSTTLPDGMVDIRVEDSGPGVRPDQQLRIFDSLFTTKTSGTGLGLPISKGIVEAHGGTLTVENADRRGAVFRIRLPSVRMVSMAPDLPAGTSRRLARRGVAGK